MDYLDEFDLVDEAAAGFAGSSPRPLSVFGGIIDDDDDDYPNDDHYVLGSSPPALQVTDDDLLSELDEFDDFDQDVEVEDEEHEDEDDHDEIEIDSDDSLDSIGIDGIDDSWNNNGGQDNTSSRSSSPPESVGSRSSQPRRIAFDDDDDEGTFVERSTNRVVYAFSPQPFQVHDARGLDDDLDIYEEEEEEDPDSPRTVLQGQFDRLQQQHQELAESRQRIADTLRELTQQRIQNQTRAWHETIESARARRGIRQALTSTSSVRDRLRPYRAPSPRYNMNADSGSSRRSERQRTSRPRSNDELVQVEVEELQPQSRRRQTQSSGRPARTEAPAVIDLTEVPDSPEGPRNGSAHSRARMPSAPRPLRQQLTFPPTTGTGTGFSNPRRQMSLNHRTPSLTRSDASLLGNNRISPQRQVDVIDLTIDDDSPPGRNNQNVPAARPAPRRHPRAPAPLPAGVHPIEVETERANNINNNNHLFGFIHRVSLGLFGATGVTVGIHNVINPLADNIPNLNYQATGYNNGGRTPSKPTHEPPTTARAGFSRDTAASGDDAFVCPACEEELVYDPDAEGPASPGKNGPSPKKARNRKDREEHHFWAVKECGHVFCKKCFDGRKPTKANKSRFRTEPDHPRKVFCAVDNCKSDVSAKSAWVGLFL